MRIENRTTKHYDSFEQMEKDGFYIEPVQYSLNFQLKQNIQDCFDSHCGVEIVQPIDDLEKEFNVYHVCGNYQHNPYYHHQPWNNDKNLNVMHLGEVNRKPKGEQENENN